MLHAKPKQCVFKNGLFYYCPILVLNTWLVSFHNVGDENRNSGGTSLRSCTRQETCILCERRLSICITRPQFLKAYLQLDDTLTRRKNCLPAVSDNNGWETALQALAMNGLYRDCFSSSLLRLARNPALCSSIISSTWETNFLLRQPFIRSSSLKARNLVTCKVNFVTKKLRYFAIYSVYKREMTCKVPFSCSSAHQIACCSV